MRVVDEYIREVEKANLLPDRYIALEKKGNHLKIEDERSGAQYDVLNFCSNDILGMAQDPAVTAAAIKAIERFGTTNSSCAALSGRIELHRDLEQEISDFKGPPDTHLFLNAWMAMQALMDGFCHLAIPVPGFRNTRETLIMTDILNHGCITSAVVNAGGRSGKMFTHSPNVRVKSYRHVDMANLRTKLARHAKPGDRIVVVTDAVFSMDGDIVPLPEMIDVLADYPGSVLVLDEAHSSGVLGPKGGGICSHFGLTTQDIRDRGIEPVIMTTFSKFAGSAGAAISAYSPELVELLFACPTSIGTISPPPPVTAAALESIRQLRARPHLVSRLRDNGVMLRRMIEDAGFETIGETNVIPVMLDDDLSPKAFAAHLMEQHGLWVSPVWFIARPRLRIVTNASHTEEQMRQLVNGMIATRDAMRANAAANNNVAAAL